MSAPGRGTPRFGATTTGRGVRFAAWSGAAERLWLCLFDASGSRETERLAMQAEENGVHAVTVPGLSAGARYGLRADGPWDPQAGLWFDPGKLLVDPYAVEIDRPYAYDPRLAAPRGEAGDTAPLVPKAPASRPGAADCAAPAALSPRRPRSTSFRCAPFPGFIRTFPSNSAARSALWHIRRSSTISSAWASAPSS